MAKDEYIQNMVLPLKHLKPLLRLDGIYITKDKIEMWTFWEYTEYDNTNIEGLWGFVYWGNTLLGQEVIW